MWRYIPSFSEGFDEAAMAALTIIIEKYYLRCFIRVNKAWPENVNSANSEFGISENNNEDSSDQK
jgi:hypothetical protein